MLTYDEFNQVMDAAEVVMDAEFERINPPTTHHFLPGFYIRQITMPKGFLCTTKTHGKRHAFHITKGRVTVKDESGEAKTLVAPYVGITEPGTRRILLCEEETVWTTFHATEYLDIGQLVPLIEEEITIPHESLVPRADALNRQPQPAIADDTR